MLQVLDSTCRWSRFLHFPCVLFDSFIWHRCILMFCSPILRFQNFIILWGVLLSSQLLQTSLIEVMEGYTKMLYWTDFYKKHHTILDCLSFYIILMWYAILLLDSFGYSLFIFFLFNTCRVCSVLPAHIPARHPNLRRGSWGCFNQINKY